MRKIAITLMALSSLGLSISSLANQIELKSETDKYSYALGMDMGNSLKNQKIDLTPEAFYQGLNASMTGGKTVITAEQAKNILISFEKQLIAKRQAEFAAASNKNKTQGEQFLASNKIKAGVNTLASGLQYKIVKVGSGAKPKASDVVTVDYTGTLIDGTEFDSSYKRGEPTSFRLSQVIPGWTEALQLMPAGSTWEIYVPAKLAYGTQGNPVIGPNSTLVFKIHLISVGDKEKKLTRK